MKRFAFSTALTLLVGTASTASAERLWVFGDSLSDNGNLSLLFRTDGNPNTYLPDAYTPYSPLPGLQLQRISNGKTAVEYVADHYGATLLPSGLASVVGLEDANNFAIFGARASLTSQLDLPYQVAQLAQRAAAGMDLSDDRALVFIGANDVFAAWGAAIAPLQAGGAIDLAAGEAVLDGAIDSLRAYLLGAGGFVTGPGGNPAGVPSLTALGITNFTVINVPDISATPWVRNTAAAFGTDTVAKAASKLTTYFNRKLARLVDDLEDEGYCVTDIDAHKISGKVRAKSKKLGFVNKDDDCFLTNTLATLTQGLPPTPGVYRDTCSAETANTFMFLDTAHPTGKVNQITGEAIVDQLSD